MLTFLVIDQSKCSKELSAFLKKNKAAVRAVYSTKFQQAAQNGPAVNMAGSKKKLVVNATDALSVLTINDIIHCESHRNYTLLHLTGDRQFMVSKTLMDIEGQLEGNRFVRIHKSHLINLNCLEKFVKAEGGYVVLTNGKKLPVAVRKKELLFKELDKM
ncbi:MAG: LytR/AlgR family response regulator transcription factor [Flavobacteriales bacterium]